MCQRIFLQERVSQLANKIETCVDDIFAHEKVSLAPHLAAKVNGFVQLKSADSRLDEIHTSEKIVLTVKFQHLPSLEEEYESNSFHDFFSSESNSFHELLA